MAQLKMYWLPEYGYEEFELPEGYSVSNYKDESDKLAWVECCKNGLVGDDAGIGAFDDSILSREDITLNEDIFFLDYQGEHIATVTAYVVKEWNIGDVHMVGMKTEFRGKGLGKYLNMIALRHLSKTNIKYAFLTTDEWRKGAVKSYLNAGFRPVEYDEGMVERWQNVLEEYGIDSVEMLCDDATVYGTVYRKGLQK